MCPPRLLCRDIKSENTLLSEGLTVKICDFGLARSALGVNCFDSQTPVAHAFRDLEARIPQAVALFQGLKGMELGFRTSH